MVQGLFILANFRETNGLFSSILLVCSVAIGSVSITASVVSTTVFVVTVVVLIFCVVRGVLYFSDVMVGNPNTYYAVAINTRVPENAVYGGGIAVVVGDPHGYHVSGGLSGFRGFTDAGTAVERNEEDGSSISSSFVGCVVCVSTADEMI